MKTTMVFGFLVLAIVLTGCAGSQFVTHSNVAGYDVIQGGRTGVFGTDNSFVYIAPKAQVAQVVSAPAPVPVGTAAPAVVPKKVLIERTYTKSGLSWTGCPDKKPNRRAKNVKREEVAEKWTEEVPVEGPTNTNPPQSQVLIVPSQAPAAFWAGGNPSTGNLVLPSAVMAGGMIGAAAALRPSDTNINQTGGGASANSSSNANAQANANANQKTNIDIGIKNGCASGKCR